MDENLQIRQNQDLIKSLNEIYSMNVRIQKEIEQIQTESQEQNQLQNDRIRQVNHMVMESKNAFGQQVRNLQNEIGDNKEQMDKTNGLMLEIESLKAELHKMRQRMMTMSNDMIVMQNHIISNGGENLNLQTKNLESESEIKTGGYFSRKHGKYIPVDTYNNHPFNGILNPKTKI